MATGTRTTYSDSSVKPESLIDAIHFIDWTEAPLLKYLGMSNSFNFTYEPRTKYEWLEDTMSAVTTTLAEAIDPAETAWNVTDGTLFKEGDIIRVQDTTGELVYVESVSSNTLTVIKGYAGTTDSAHDSGATVEFLYPARIEGADFDTGHTTTVTRNYNYTQIFAEAVRVTGSEMVDKNYGIDDVMSYNLQILFGGGGQIGAKGKAGKLSIALQKTFYYGQRAAGTASTSRAMGGFEYYVTTNVTDLNSAALTLKNIEDLYEDCYLAGGSPSMIVCNTWVWRKINEFFAGTITTERSEAEGGHAIKHIRTVMGDMDIMFDRWCPTDRLYLIEPDKMGWFTYRPWNVYERPASGDYEVREVLGEFGFVLTNQLAHGYIKEISTTS
jgi:hypothetical protein